MNPALFIWLIDAFWLILIAYLIVAAIGVKQDTQGHLAQSFGLLFAIIAAFLLPYLPIFQFLNFAPVNPVVSSIGVFLRRRHGLPRLGAAASWQELEPDCLHERRAGTGNIGSVPLRTASDVYRRPYRVPGFGDCLWRCFRLSSRHPRFSFSLAGERRRQAHGATISDRIP